MGTKGEAFAGLAVALVTPFKNGEVDYDVFREQIEFQIFPMKSWSLLFSLHNL